MTAALKISATLLPDVPPTVESRPAKLSDLPESARIFRGRELTLKTRRIGTGLDSLDRLIGGGIVRGRISEILGPVGAGKTSLAMAFAAVVTRSEAAAWVETHDQLDPASLVAAGVEPARLLWVSCRRPNPPRRRLTGAAAYADGIVSDDNESTRRNGEARQVATTSLKTAEWILAAGGFGLLVIDFGDAIRFLPQSAPLRLARAAERSGAAIIVLARYRMCGTFAVLSLELSRRRAHFNRIARGAGATFDGQLVEARVIRNKLGGSGETALWSTAVEPHDPFSPSRGSPRSRLALPHPALAMDDRARSGPAYLSANTAV